MNTCPAINCKKEIPQSVIFCQPHWWALPHDLKKKLLKPKSKEDHQTAMRQAIGVICYKEGAEMPDGT